MSYIRALIEFIQPAPGTSRTAHGATGQTDGTPPVLIRMARAGDLQRLREIAELDSAPPLSEPSLIAVVDNRAWAALSLVDGRVIADPFRPTSSTVALLRMRADQLQDRPAAGRAAHPLGRVWRRARA